jgi:uncharacterized membrane protein YGL010W
MKTIQNWLDEYAVSHQNPTNKKVHFVCVPLIFFSVVGLFYSIPVSLLDLGFIQLNVATILLLLVTIYYARLSVSLAVGMFLFSTLCLIICEQIVKSGLSLPLVSIGIFVLAWIAQFWGHGVEGKKPSFAKDLQFLMIGPAWIMSFIYKKAGISL